jgi:hypothetical protein
VNKHRCLFISLFLLFPHHCGIAYRYGGAHTTILPRSTNVGFLTWNHGVGLTLLIPLPLSTLDLLLVSSPKSKPLFFHFFRVHVNRYSSPGKSLFPLTRFRHLLTSPRARTDHANDVGFCLLGSRTPSRCRYGPGDDDTPLNSAIT